MCVVIGGVRDVRRSGVAEECSRCEAVDQCNNKALRRKMHARTIFVDRATLPPLSRAFSPQAAAPSPLLCSGFLTASRERMDLKYSRFKLQVWTIVVPLTRNKQTFADLGPKFAYCGLTDPPVVHKCSLNAFLQPPRPI